MPFWIVAQPVSQTPKHGFTTNSVLQLPTFFLNSRHFQSVTRYIPLDPAVTLKEIITPKCSLLPLFRGFLTPHICQLSCSCKHLWTHLWQSDLDCGNELFKLSKQLAGFHSNGLGSIPIASPEETYGVDIFKRQKDQQPWWRGSMTWAEVLTSSSNSWLWKGTSVCRVCLADGLLACGA